MTLSIFTSCAINYLPKARALAESLRRHNPEARLTLCLNDQPPAWLDLAAEPFDQTWLPSDLGYDAGWIFQHNVMELSTAVKGRALKRLVAETEGGLIAYLDPDVFLFDSLDPVHDMMEGASIGLVPHILAPEQTELGVELTEKSVTRHGIYNLGHLFVRPDETGSAFADWWAARLDRHCFDDIADGLFTDQRWCDLVPSIFDSVRILRDPGLNVASWNIATRHIQANKDQSGFSAERVPLLTYHFSGTGPQGTHKRLRETFNPGNPAMAEIERIYEDAIARHGQSRLSQISPAHDFFDDGTHITARARRLYRKHGDLREAYPNPYVGGDTESYLNWLRANHPGIVDGLTIAESRMRRAFDDLFDADYYLRTNPDAERAVASGQYQSAVDHYCAIGSRLGLDPNPFFVATYYADQVAEFDSRALRLTRQGREGTLLWHYLTIGLPNSVEPIELFASRWYLEQNPDVALALKTGGITSPLAHFLWHGAAEGREPGPGFSAAAFLEATPKAQEIVDAGQVHGAFGAFVALGGVAGRVLATPQAVLDPTWVTA